MMQNCVGEQKNFFKGSILQEECMIKKVFVVSRFIIIYSRHCIYVYMHGPYAPGDGTKTSTVIYDIKL